MVNMGNSLFKLKVFISLSNQREIVSEKSLRSIKTIANFLKTHGETRRVVTDTGRRRIRQISNCINSSSGNLIILLDESTQADIIAALQYFLLKLPKPLIPKYIQDLALDAEGDVPSEIIAADILGLIRQDLEGRHLYLVEIIMDLLAYLRKHSVRSELVGSSVPITMMPVFFNLQPEHLPRWRFIATIFLELVDLSATFLPMPGASESNVTTFEEILPFHIGYNLIDNGNEDLILHQIYAPLGSHGDANFAEFVSLSRLRRTELPKMLNPVFGYFVRRFK